MTMLDQTAPSAAPINPVHDLTGIVVVSIPVVDLAVSAAWYRDLLELDYVREFGDQQSVTGCALADFTARYMIALRLRSATAGQADLRGEHPVIVEAADAAAAERVRARAEALGIPSTCGQHADGHWIEFIDPDGIALRVVHGAAGPQSFLGIRYNGNDDWDLYQAPRLALAKPRRAGDHL